MNYSSKLALAIYLILPSYQVNAIDLIGNAEARQAIEVVSEVSGMIANHPLQPGTPVHRGEPLITISPEDFQLEVRKQKANVALVSADLKIKRSLYLRYQELRNKNSLSQNELDIAEADYQAAKAQLQLAQIELEKSEIDLHNTRIHSEIDGFIIKKSVDKGSWVEKGTTLYHLVCTKKIIARLHASEYDIPQLKVGQAIKVWSDVKPDVKVDAKIKRIGVELDETSLAYPIDVEITNENGHFLPGMALHATTDV
ncbi:efflux RND transporter periplasmic adaptor subunit [Photobacterium sp. BZF1]|uniref:efflux RND transporter periplasmic adaptor subunit n=1 Tax=Photobacterium sp. BZF1 TaxID=1904457 RepID=UPI001653C689|nr:efflux RND transporter periplasmic adaptor subunit [Photobacterium sp. BZF1]MBC7003918.1 efflux RND transporter periplasmic adaptor subunit [Photobacterium sp. BZF1]